MRNRNCVSFDPVTTQCLCYAAQTLMCGNICVFCPHSAFVWVRE